MSTGQECWFYEDKPNEWYVMLEADWASRYDAFPNDESDCFGPFSTEGDGDDFLHEHFANPGGAMIFRHDGSRKPTSETITKLIVRAPARKKLIEGSSLGGGVWIVR